MCVGYGENHVIFTFIRMANYSNGFSNIDPASRSQNQFYVDTVF